MEIILALFVFFGGYTLGSISTENKEVSAQITNFDEQEGGIARKQLTPPIIYVNESSARHNSHTIIYRDLTRSPNQEYMLPASEDDDCDEEDSDE